MEKCIEKHFLINLWINFGFSKKLNIKNKRVHNFKGKKNVELCFSSTPTFSPPWTSASLNPNPMSLYYPITDLTKVTIPSSKTYLCPEPNNPLPRAVLPCSSSQLRSQSQFLWTSWRRSLAMKVWSLNRFPMVCFELDWIM